MVGVVLGDSVEVRAMLDVSVARVVMPSASRGPLRAKQWRIVFNSEGTMWYRMVNETGTMADM
jgi:hypothetical protein